MSQKTAGNAKTNPTLVKDTLESLRDRNDIFSDYEQFEPFEFNREKPTKTPAKKEFKLFNYQEYYENTLIKREIKDLTEQIRREIELIKKADKTLINEVRDIQKLTVDTLAAKPGIYHIRFLEVILEILKSLRAKIGESRTWLAALTSKKKKRGSLFASRSKKQGTQYSLSQELQSARSIQ